MSIVMGRTLIIIITVALACYVGSRAWHHRPARMFVLFAGSLVLISVVAIAREVAGSAAEALATRRLALLVPGISVASLHLMLAALFVPEWWQERQPIRWITLPYSVSITILAADLLSAAGFFATFTEAGDRTFTLVTTPAGYVMLGAFFIGSMLPVLVLIVSFVRRPEVRGLIGILAGAIVASIIISSIPGLIGLPQSTSGIVLTLFLLSGPAYAVLRTDLLIPIRLASDLALHSMRDAVVVVGTDGAVMFANPSAKELGTIEGQPINTILLTMGIPAEQVAVLSTISTDNQPHEQTLIVNQRQLDLSIAPIMNSGRRYGTLVIGRDMTDMAQRTTQLEQERIRLDSVVRELTIRERERDQLAATVQALSLPLIPVLDGVLVLPLVGAFDLMRQQSFIEVLLTGITQERARLVLIDITGVPLIDTTGAQSLLRAVEAARLLGARCVLVGVRPEIAQALVSLGIQLEVRTSATLQKALQAELQRAF
jgi:anti-anti-sigma regulatory factor/PAS domain-containing protein